MKKAKDPIRSGLLLNRQISANFMFRLILLQSVLNLCKNMFMLIVVGRLHLKLKPKFMNWSQKFFKNFPIITQTIKLLESLSKIKK